MNQYEASLLKECVSGCNKDFDCPHNEIPEGEEDLMLESELKTNPEKYG